MCARTTASIVARAHLRNTSKDQCTGKDGKLKMKTLAAHRHLKRSVAGIVGAVGGSTDRCRKWYESTRLDNKVMITERPRQLF